MLKKLSVVIVTYKNVQLVRDCLDSIQKYNDIGDALEVIVSDNTPDDEVYQAITTEYAWVKTIKNENKGFGYGNNRGVEVSTGEYLLFLNPDTLLIEPVFGFIVEKFETEKDLALCGVQLQGKDGRDASSFYLLDKSGPIHSLYLSLCQKMRRFVDGKMYIIGADTFIRRSVFDEAGGFDENIFMFREEPDLLRSVKKYATVNRTAFFPQKRIVHLEGGTEENSADTVISRLRRIVIADKYYAKKWQVDLRKMYEKRLGRQGFKLFLYRLFGKKEKVELQLRLIEEYKDIVENWDKEQPTSIR